AALQGPRLTPPEGATNGHLDRVTPQIASFPRFTGCLIGPPQAVRERACLSVGRPPHTPAIAISPIRKLQKISAIDQDGNLVTTSRLPSVAVANKPPGWNRRSAAARLSISSSSWTPCTTISVGLPVAAMIGGVDRDDRYAGHQAREAGYAALFRGICKGRIDEGFAWAR